MVGMDDNHRDVPGGVQNASEPVQNGAEHEEVEFGTVPKSSEHVQNNAEVRSEHVQNNSADRSEQVPNGSEQRQGSKDVSIRIVRNEIKTVPNNAEPIAPSAEHVPNDIPEQTEPFGTEEASVPNEPERFRTAPVCTEEHDGFTITIREAARIFEEAGVPRTERAITKWCNMNTRGVARLDCCYNEAERKYYITPESIERVTVEERKKFQYVEYRNGGVLSADAEDLSEQLRHEQSDGSEHVQNTEEHPPHEQHTAPKEERSEQPRPRTERAEGKQEDRPEGGEEGSVETREELRKLQMENFNLKVQLEGQKFLVMKFDELVAGERERHNQEKLALVDRLTDARHQIGTLEQKLLQLEAPRGPLCQHD
jgi:hypothetical protein